MCGICGVARLTSRVADRDREAIGRMIEILRHRGPDGHGVWQGDHVVFGHTRLSIIDISGGHQPMLNETGDVVVTLNGEIYNFAELRVRLARAGHVFRTRSDTEVVVHGYEEWGDAVVDHLRGMFAFAIWDGRRRRLVLARDRYGEKPLYYYSSRDRGELLFASEIKALLYHPRTPSAFNVRRLAEFLAFRSVAGAETLFEGIEEVPPATVMAVEAGGIRQVRYWSPDVRERIEAPLSGGRARGTSAHDALVEEGRRLLSEAVRERLVSEVGIGTITSGGLDSSLVTAIASEVTGRPLDTFCVGFADPAYDERPFARQMAAHLGARLHEIEVAAADIDRELDLLTWAHDEPLTHPNAIPMHLLFRHAKVEAGITVLLSGEGADELFGGYDWYRVAARRESFLPLAPLRHLLPGRGRLAVLRRVLGPDYPLVANATTSLREISALGVGGDALATRRLRWPDHRRGVDGLFAYDQGTYLPPLLQRQDRMSMAAGVEARVVFLDHLLAEWANRLPASVKIPDGRRKELLKQVAARWVPASIRDRRKVGFVLPLGDWLRPGGALHPRVERLREPSSFVRSLIDPRRLDPVLREHGTGAADHTDVIWSLIALESWAGVLLDFRFRSPAADHVLPTLFPASSPVGQRGGVGPH